MNYLGSDSFSLIIIKSDYSDLIIQMVTHRQIHRMQQKKNVNILNSQQISTKHINMDHKSP